MTTSSEPATRLKKGDLILLPGEGDAIFKIKKLSTSSPGKHGHAKVRIQYYNLLTESGGEVSFSGHKEIEKPIIEKSKAQVLSVTPGKTHKDPNKPDEPAHAQLMDLETYDTYTLPVPEEISEDDLQAGVELDVRSYESNKWIERISPTSG